MSKASVLHKTHKDSFDFIPTISDSDNDEIPDLDIDEDDGIDIVKGEEEVVGADKVKYTKPKDKKDINQGKKRNASKVESGNNQDMNPDFIFDVGDDMVTDFQGWDFEPTQPEKKLERKEVDLDSIIKRKGGLAGKLAVDDNDEDVDNKIKEESEPKSQDSEPEVSKKNIKADNDDELAMDGFGMGVEKDSTDETSVEKGSKNDSTEKKEEIEEIHDLKMEDDEDDEEEQKDSEEAIQKFYDNAKGEEAKKSVYDDFQTMNLSRPVLKSIQTLGYTKPTPVQSASIPIALMGKDIVAGAQTGSGKTAAYMIPIVERLLYKPSRVAATRVVILAPTRELALQVADVAKKLSQYAGNITIGLAIGGLNLRQQEQQLKKRPDIVIATPGRFIDHVRNSPSFNVDTDEILVLDEADRMLEEGFHAEISEILQFLPQKRQTMLFSATMNSNISDLIQLSLKKPVRIMIDPPKAAASGLLQEFVRIRKRDSLKPALLYDILTKIDANGQSRVIVFVATKSLAHRLRIIMGLLGLKVSELHGALTQEQRLESITAFKKLTVPILICTDLAARGLDIPKIEVVINFDMPKSHEIYLHRVGRTARAGRNGVAISFVGGSSRERRIVRESIKQIEEAQTGRAVSRKVDWNEINKINDIIDKKSEVIKDVLDEEKAEKEMLQAEMEIQKGENLLKYKKEITSRPKRTWFQSEREKKQSKVITAMGNMKKSNNRRKRKAEESTDGPERRSYKKTQKDRMEDQSGKRRWMEINKKRQKRRAKRFARK